MIRIPKYEPRQITTRVGNIDPGFVQPLVNHVGQDAASSTAQSLLDSGKQLTDVAIKEYVSQETARVSQSLLAMKGDMAAERDRYMQENQGEKALGAGAHFEQFAQKTAQDYMQKGGFSGKFAQMFTQQAAMDALSFTETGQAYGRQQKQAWQDSVIKGETESFLADAAQHYNDPEWLEANRPAIQERINNLRPGMDNRALFGDVDQKAAAATVEGFLANNNVGGARAWLKQNGAMAGEKLNGFVDKVNARGRELEARARAEAEMRFVGAFANDPLKGIAEISTPEGMAKYGMDAKTAISVRSMLQTQWSFNKTVEKQKNDAYVTSTVTGIYTTLMGDPDKGIAPDPAKAYQDLQNSNLDAITKIEMGKKLEEGTIGKTRDPAAVNDMARQIVNGDIDSDAPIDVMLAQGKASVGDVSMLKSMRKDMDSPLKDYLKRADHLINNAFARSQFAAGTPEAAIKEDRARSQLRTVITEAYKKGGPEAVEKLFSSDTPMSIMNSNAITVDDALSSVNRVISAGGAGKEKKPVESANTYLQRRVQGAAQ